MVFRRKTARYGFPKGLKDLDGKRVEERERGIGLRNHERWVPA